MTLVITLTCIGVGFTIGTFVSIVVDIRANVTKTVDDNGDTTYEGSASVPKWLGRMIDGKRFRSNNTVLNWIVRKVFFG